MTGSGRRVLVIGGGPAGLMAAECARACGADVDLCEQLPSVARKFLIAGKGGLNLTHSEALVDFVARYRERAPQIGEWLRHFGPKALREWARALGHETVIGSSGRVFPADFKAGPLLRAWLRRIRASGVRVHCGWRWNGWDEAGHWRFESTGGAHALNADAVVLALGGGSWSRLGADARWRAPLAARGVDIAPLRAANCGFECAWSERLLERHAGAPIKGVSLRLADTASAEAPIGEFVLTRHGIEGSAVYALAAELRERIARDGHAELLLDLAPRRSQAQLTDTLKRERGKRTLAEHLRRCTGIDGARAALVFESPERAALADPARMAARIKSLSLRLTATRPLDEAISSAGGVRLEALTEALELRALPGVWCAGEMLDWEAPTGGYLLTACFASGWIAGHAAAKARP
ncbi:MAG: TIGR03862 family flavoprotein [Xanthomonadales bacterium]|nr:TIGR03862 family flavoprotein [Xanthomonadales bacterium]MCE7931176.1 TIGR03862 family flavoprotein [Xanthomonadales bacterium PRO6]